MSIYGKVESRWERADGKSAFTVTVPANCTAEVRLPDGSTRVQAAGTERYIV